MTACAIKAILRLPINQVISDEQQPKFFEVPRNNKKTEELLGQSEYDFNLVYTGYVNFCSEIKKG